MRVEADGRTIEVSNADRVMFPDDGITKGDVVAYYRDVAPWMVPHLAGRPLTLHRFPKGIAEQGFWQKGAPKFYPSWIRRVRLPKAGGEIDMAICDDAATLVYCANQNGLTHHVWLSRADGLFNPDLVMVDLDPSGADDAELVRATAFEVRDLLSSSGLVPYVKTSGSKGLHVVAPIDRSGTFEDAHGFASWMAGRLLERHPDRLTTEFSKADRAGRLYLDVGRNTWAQTAAAPYTVRALPGAPVSAPVTWDELAGGVQPRAFTLANVRDRLETTGDPWGRIWDDARPLPGRTLWDPEGEAP